MKNDMIIQNMSERFHPYEIHPTNYVSQVYLQVVRITCVFIICYLSITSLHK